MITPKTARLARTRIRKAHALVQEVLGLTLADMPDNVRFGERFGDFEDCLCAIEVRLIDALDMLNLEYADICIVTKD